MRQDVLSRLVQNVRPTPPSGEAPGTARGVALQLGLELAELGAQPDDGLETRRVDETGEGVAALRRARHGRRLSQGARGYVVTMPGSVLVTGAAKGIGRAIAERLAGDGWAIGFATHARDDESRAAYKEVASRAPAHWVAGDLSDASTPERLLDELCGALGPLSGLVNNAGLTTAGGALELGSEEFDKTFAVDVRAAFLLAQGFARQAPDGGAIVNVTSVHELVPRPGFVVYAAAKAALGMLTRGLALELAARGIRVNAVAPGAIATERNEEADALAPEIPLGRPGRPRRWRPRSRGCSRTRRRT